VDPSFVVVVALSLAMISLMLAIRLLNGGASTSHVARLIAELWLVFAIWIGVLWAVSRRLGTEAGIGGVSDLEAVGRRFGALPGGEKGLLVASVLLSLAIFLHLTLAVKHAASE
jgi:hypothetical protein